MSGDTPEGLGWLGATTWSCHMGRGISRRSKMGRENLPEFPYGSEELAEVRDELGDPPGGPRQVGQPSRRFGTGRGTHHTGPRRVSGPPKSLGQVDEPSRMSETGRGTLREVQDGSETLWEVQDGSGDPPGGWGRVGDPPGDSGWVDSGPRLVGRSSEKFGMGLEVLPGCGTGQRTFSVVWDVWGGPFEGLRRVGRSFERSGTGQRTLQEVQDKLGYL